MSNKWVVNASPLILLAKVGQIELLPRLTEHLVIPASVVEEVQKGPAVDPAQKWLREEGTQWICGDLPPVAAVLGWAHQHREF